MSSTAAVVESFEIWTAAVEARSRTGRGNAAKMTLNGIERLRTLILELAVRGKLVPQNATDEPTSDLLKKIDRARSKLIEEGFIRGKRIDDCQRLLSEPFEIPSSWVWVRLDRVGAIVGGGTPPANDRTNFAEPGEGIPWLTPADLSGYAEKYIQRGQRDLTKEGAANSSAKVMPAGTVLFTSRAPIGYVAIAENPISTNQGFKSVVPAFEGMSEFIALCFRAFRDEIDANAPGTTFKEVSGKIVSAIPFPLPPLAEQQRIVAKVDELMALCDALGAQSSLALEAHQTLVETLLATLVNSAGATDLASNWERLESHFDTLFIDEGSIDALKQTVLDLAVRGKLVPRQTAEGSGQTLLRELKALRRAKGLKDWTAKQGRSQDRLLDGADCIPKHWAIARLGDLTTTITDGTHKTPSYQSDGIAFISVKDIDGNTIHFDDCKFISEAEHRSINARCSPQRDDILICRIGTLGRATIVDTDRPFSLFVSVGLLKFVRQHYCARYQHIALSSPTLARQFEMIKAGGSHTNKLNLGDLPRLEIPLPPLPEQRRIVAKVDQLLALCDTLKAGLSDAAKTQRNLADAIVEKAAA